MPNGTIRFNAPLEEYVAQPPSAVPSVTLP
jgi:hypothetical protein